MSLEYTVSFYTGATKRTLNDVLSLDVSVGRRLIVDSYTPGIATIRSRNIAAWPATVKQGQPLEIANSFGVVFGGTISDVQINYGLKSSLDEATITVEAGLRNWGRREVKNAIYSQNEADVYATAIASGNSIPFTVYNSPLKYQSILSAQTYSGNLLDLLNTIIITNVSRLFEVWDSTNRRSEVFFYGRNETIEGVGTDADEPVVFADTANTVAAYLEFDIVEFASSSENYYTKVTVNPLGLATQNSTTGAAPYQELNIDTLDYSTTQADSLSQYLLAAFGSTDAQIMTLSATYNQQEKTTAYAATKTDLFRKLQCNQGALEIKVIFRGTTYYCILEGMQINATPTDTSVTLNLSSQDLNSYLRWTRPSPYNTWDNNKWGF